MWDVQCVSCCMRGTMWDVQYVSCCMRGAMWDVMMYHVYEVPCGMYSRCHAV